jgi:co-chaperonin GroES (HSP10)
MSKFHPLSDRILVLPDAAPVKQGGLAQPASQQDVPTQGVVVAAGPEALKVRIPTTGGPVIFKHGSNPQGVEVGQRIQWARFSGRDLLVDGVPHKLLRLEEIDGIIEA